MPSSPVTWLPDGTPYSAAFDDIYRSAGAAGLGGWAQAQQVFLGGCGLTGDAPLWQGTRRWTVLENGFGLGLNYLATWYQWRAQRQAALAAPPSAAAARAGLPPPRVLHYVATEAFPVTADDLLQSAAPFAAEAPGLLPLAQQLAQQWQGLLPGFHRLVFEDGALQLTLCVGEAKAMLRELRLVADSVFLDGFDPALNPQMWDAHTLKAIAHLCRRGTRVATWSVARPVRQALAQCGFEVETAVGLPPKRHRLQGQWAPRWQPRFVPAQPLWPHLAAPENAEDALKTRAGATVSTAQNPVFDRKALVIGSGLAGACAAYSLALRGWRVTVLEAGPYAACGASALPVGLVAPHVSPDDRALSQLTRAGLMATLARARSLLREGHDWAPSGVLERRIQKSRELPAAWADAANPGHAWSHPADASRLAQAGLGAAPHPAGARSGAHWHPRAGWIRPAALVQAMLTHPAITLRTGAQVGRLAVDPGGLQRWLATSNVSNVSTASDAAGWLWQAVAADGAVLAQAPLVVVAAGYPSAALLRSALDATLPAHPLELPLNPLRGQITWAAIASDLPAGTLPPFPVNGLGNFISGMSIGARAAWVLGSSFDRGCDQPLIKPEDALANFDKLAQLLPQAAARLRPQLDAGQTHAWAAVRCTVPDRVPIAGAVDAQRLPGLMVSTALGARGLTLAVLCGELLAAQLDAEPLPVPARLAALLRVGRFG